MKRSPSNRGANLSSTAEPAVLLLLLSSLDGDPVELEHGEVRGSPVAEAAADATAVAAAEAAAAAAPHLIARGLCERGGKKRFIPSPPASQLELRRT